MKLRDFAFGGILAIDNEDVLRILLADPPPSPAPGPHFSVR